MAGTWREPNQDDAVPFPEALEAWAIAAVPILEDVAREYGGYITYSDLANQMFDVTGIRTRMLLTNFSSRLLNKVIARCKDGGLPQLTSLVVNATDGTVGSGFDASLRAAGQEVPDTALGRERAAASERLACYRRYCADGEVPVDAEPKLTPKYEAKVNPPKIEAPKPKPVCPVHAIQLPATGVCDDCA